jgi:molybdopterin synthase catalytic subunit
MTGRVMTTGVSAQPLDPEALLASVDDPAGGAAVCFVGRVRDHDGGRTVTALEYHEHPSAAGVVAGIAQEIAARDGVLAVSVVHRTGLLGVGQIAIVAAVSAAHRAEAFTACSDLVDEVKHRLPVWKRQVFDDDTDEWVGSA